MFDFHQSHLVECAISGLGFYPGDPASINFAILLNCGTMLSGKRAIAGEAGTFALIGTELQRL